MYAGRPMENGPAREVFAAPQHPYTWGLLQSMPTIERRLETMLAHRGLASVAAPCPHWLPVQPTLRVRVRAVHRRAPRVRPIPGGHLDRCHLPEERKRSDWAEMRALRTRSGRLSETATDTIMELRHVTKHFPVQHGVFSRTKSRVHAVEDVSLTVRRGETLGIVGESGCGKSTTARLMLRLIDPTGGTIRFDGRDITGTVDARAAAASP